MNRIREELIKNTMHPRRIIRMLELDEDYEF
jgi:hypothetical protein